MELARNLTETIMKRYPRVNEYPFCFWIYPQGYILIGISKLWESTREGL